MVSASIILTTYNRKDLLEEMVSNIQSQIFQNYELIIVNDGSTDGTDQWLIDNCESNSNIRIVNKENGGISSARNAGIDVAKGDYILFVDDDDDIPTTFLSNFFNCQKREYDLIVDSYSHKADNKKPTLISFPECEVTGNKDILDYFFHNLKNKPFPYFVYAKLFKRSLIVNNHIRFRPDICLGEDRCFVLDYLQYCNSLKFINTHSYTVRERSNQNYRLSQGTRKPANYFWRNFDLSYDYLVEYSTKMGMPIIARYANNYLAEKLYYYILVPYSQGKYERSAINKIMPSVQQKLENLKLRDIKSSEMRLIIGLFRSNPRIAVSLLKYRMKLSKLIK
ncbi:MAG: glycosyltransferase family 2 protein [Bacteroidales bacterium]|nr:glycosyltransferase family 2 protein [Bacteroidales bacterium]